jgi:hypothetical protein
MAANAAMTAPATAPLIEDLSCCMVADPWAAPSVPDDVEGKAGEVTSDSSDEDTAERDVNVGLTLSNEIAVDGVETVGAGPAVILNWGLSARTL